MSNRPKGREKHINGTASGVYKKGSGLNSGPVGFRKTAGGSKPAANGLTRAGLPVALILMLLMGGGNLSGLLGGSANEPEYHAPSNTEQVQQNNHATSIPVNNPVLSEATTTETVNTEVAKGARKKYTKILGNGKDKTTIMIYMCGTDLESRSGMARADLTEIAQASSSDQIDIVIYTGGCQNWQINGISNTVNQIYTIKEGKLIRLEDNMGAKPMVEPGTLTEFINYCTKNFPANRYDLIMWDHGGGSISGYGMDQNYQRAGSMTLSKINEALTASKTKFDFIGFDACLMATAENALMLNEHADYLVASEETEPGIGWYYTKWVDAYANNPSMDTLSIAKNIIDGFIEECDYRVSGQPATLSVIDLAEFDAKVPEKLKEWSKATTELIANKQYKEIARARQATREFNQNRIDQCDFVDLLKKMDTKESNSLAKTLLSAIKYNRTSRTMSNAYGVSIYFPNRKPSSVNQAAQINEAIGVSDEFNECMKEYASLQLAGQSVSYGNGNSTNPYSALFGTPQGSVSSSSETSDILQELFFAGLNAMLSPRTIQERSMSEEATIDFITENQFDARNLVWKNIKDYKAISLPEDQWSLVTELVENMFIDDGKGYIDLGYDNVYGFDPDGNLFAPQERTWLTINNQVIAYYYASQTDFGDVWEINGYTPALLNNERVVLYITFNNEHPIGFVAGYTYDYEDMSDVVAKMVTPDEDGRLFKDGDVLQFICDYYDYDGNYINSYHLGNAVKLKGEPVVSDAYIKADTLVSYKFKDIYGTEYWSESLR